MKISFYLWKYIYFYDSQKHQTMKCYNANAIYVLIIIIEFDQVKNIIWWNMIWKPWVIWITQATPPLLDQHAFEVFQHLRSQLWQLPRFWLVSKFNISTCKLNTEIRSLVTHFETILGLVWRFVICVLGNIITYIEAVWL